MLTVRTGAGSPFGRKVRIAVSVLGLDDKVRIDSASTQDASDPIRQQNPLGKIPVLLLEALADGILDASILVVYEGRYRPAEKHEQKWLDLQAGKVSRSLAALEAAPPGLDAPPNVGQITLACALGYRDSRFEPTWRKDHPRL